MTGLKASGAYRKRYARKRKRIIVLIILNVVLALVVVPFVLTKDKAPKVISDTMSYEEKYK